MEPLLGTWIAIQQVQAEPKERDHNRESRDGLYGGAIL